MKLHGSDNRGGIHVKTYTKSTCSHLFHFLSVGIIFNALYIECMWRRLTFNLARSDVVVVVELMLNVLRCHLTH